MNSIKSCKRFCINNQSLMFEKHDKDCSCSYCKDWGIDTKFKIKYGLNIPECKSRTSWFVIKYWKNRYIRFTLPNSILKIFWKDK